MPSTNFIPQMGDAGRDFSYWAPSAHCCPSLAVSRRRDGTDGGRQALQRYLESGDPARAMGRAAPATAVLFGAYFPDYAELWPLAGIAP